MQGLWQIHWDWLSGTLWNLRDWCPTSTGHIGDWNHACANFYRNGVQLDRLTETGELTSLTWYIQVRGIISAQSALGILSKPKWLPAWRLVATWWRCNSVWCTWPRPVLLRMLISRIPAMTRTCHGQQTSTSLLGASWLITGHTSQRYLPGGRPWSNSWRVGTACSMGTASEHLGLGQPTKHSMAQGLRMLTNAYAWVGHRTIHNCLSSGSRAQSRHARFYCMTVRIKRTHPMRELLMMVHLFHNSSIAPLLIIGAYVRTLIRVSRRRVMVHSECWS